MAKIKCPKCEHEVQAGAAECPKCGLIFKKYQEGIIKAQKYKEEKIKRENAEQQKKLTPCNACRSTISKLAVTCPRCGEPQNTDNKHDPFEDSSAFGIFNFQFSSYVTPSLVKVVYALTVAFILIILGISILTSIFEFGGVDTFKMLGSVMIGSIFLILIVRLFCESALLLFKIEENTRR